MGIAPTLSAIIELGRPQQVIKNLIILAPLVFSHSFWDPHKAYAAAVAFVLFSAAAASVYMFNDIIDWPQDRQNPLRQERPLVRGALSHQTAWITSLLLAIGSLLLSYLYFLPLAVVLLTYLVLNAAYVVWIKYQPILEMFSVALGFVLRILAGIVVIEVAATPWMIGVTFFLALFIVAGKRLREFTLIGDPTARRAVLRFYTKPFLDMTVSSSLIFAVVIYLLYAILEVQSPLFLVTVLPVLYGTLHFVWLFDHSNLFTDSPTDFIYREKGLLVAIASFCLLIMAFFILIPVLGRIT